VTGGLRPNHKFLATVYEYRSNGTRSGDLADAEEMTKRLRDQSHCDVQQRLTGENV